MSESGSYGGGESSSSAGSIFGRRGSGPSESVSTGESWSTRDQGLSYVKPDRSSHEASSGSASKVPVLKQFLKSNEDYIVQKAGPQISAGFVELYRLAIVKNERSLISGQAALTADLLVNMLEDIAPLYPQLLQPGHLATICAWLREKQRNDQLDSSALKYW